jgi:hypothetical protein
MRMARTSESLCGLEVMKFSVVGREGAMIRELEEGESCWKQRGRT